MQITNEIKEKILDSIDIVEIISETVTLKKHGRNYIGLCPFHSEKTPSFTVSQEKNIYKCFGCGKSGNAITFLMDYHGLSFIEAIKELAKRANIIIPEKDFDLKDKYKLTQNDIIYQILNKANEFYRKMLNTTAGKIASQFFAKRGFTHETIKEFQLGYSPDSWDATINELLKNGFNINLINEAGLVIAKEDGSYYDRFRGRVMFPIHNSIGKIIAFGARKLNDEDTQAKYINSPQTSLYDKSKTLYGIFQAKNEIRAKNYVILVEGYADVISLHQAGYKNCVASSGTALTKEQLEILSKITKILYLAYDSDEAGIKATERAIDLAIEYGFDLRIVRLPQNEDPDSIIQKFGSNVFKTYLNKAENFIEFKFDILKSQLDFNSPHSKAYALRELINIIRKIPDRLQHDDYISKLANLFNLTFYQIKKVYEEKNFQDKKETKKSKSNTLNKTDNKSLSENTAKITDINILKEEKIIINLALTSPKMFLDIASKLNFTIDNFISSKCKSLYVTILSLLNNKNFNLDTILSNTELDETDKDILIRLAISEDPLTMQAPSELWSKFGRELPEKNLYKILNDAIINLEIIKIDNRINELKTLLQNDNLNYSLIKEIKILNNKKISLKQKAISTKVIKAPDEV